MAEFRDEETCEHCWHDTGYVLTSNPPINTYYCCNCDQRKQESIQYRAPVIGHGPFLKKQPY